MNILFISSQFPNSVEPNKGMFSKQIVLAMAKRHSIQVISPVPHIGILGFLNKIKKYKVIAPAQEVESLAGIPVHCPRYFAVPVVSTLQHFFLYRTLYRIISRIAQTWHIDVVNCHWLYPDGVAAQTVCNRLEIPVMLSALGSDLNRYMGFKLRRSFIVNALNQADAVSVLNQEMFDLCLSSGVTQRNIHVIPNGVDTEKFIIRDQDVCRKKISIPIGPKIVLFVGSLYHVKNVGTLIVAFAKAVKKMNNVKILLYITGKGYLLNELQRLVAERQLEDRVVFIGQVSHDELPVLMSAADCLCLPSFSEGHPNVMMEAMACGTPVVGSRVGSMPDFINDESGFLFNPHNAEELSEMLQRCLSFPYNRLTIRKRVVGLTWENCADAYISCLAKMTETL